MEPVVSIIVPAYNRERYVVAAIKSLINQDFDKSYEIIVVDDGSTDATRNAIGAVEDSKVRYIYQDNAGASSARRKGIIAAKASVVCFLDSDDVARPNYLSSLWNGLTRDSDVVLAYGRTGDMAGRSLPEENLPPVDRNNILADPISALLEFGCFTISMNLMTYKKHALYATEGREKVLASNDYDFCLRIALKGRFAFVDSITLLINRLDDGISSRSGHKQVAFAILNACSAVRLSGRKDLLVRQSLRYRVRLLWPSAAAQLIYNKNFIFLGRVLCSAAPFMSFSDLKRFYWALDHHSPRSRIKK